MPEKKLFPTAPTLVGDKIYLRPATPEDIAEVVLFLCGPAADMIRGQVLVVDGGYSITT